ncbi:hypothetical protein DH2020_018847 [Rehmannia glutinosa]|uniref:Uncharacterized protein n=1 Tax=Rehmannia glutinosa TaxID=99300 RepID=A0ABR0WL93_REHGL
MGQSINVWRDPWLRDQSNFWTTTQQVDGLEDLRVNDLFVPGSFEWDVGMIEEYFSERDVNQILSIPLCNSGEMDRQIWHFSKTGSYTVNSGYTRLVHRVIDDALGHEASWDKIWKLRIPPKVKFFLWRTCKGCLPTRTNLGRKGVHIPQFCVMCEAHLENCWHTFIDCGFGVDCWHEAHLWTTVNIFADKSVSFQDWVFKMLNDLDQDISTKICMSRRRQQDASSVSGCQLWHLPSRSYWKCNSDAAFFRGDNKYGIGLILRDDTGSVVACRTLCWQGQISVIEGEAVGLLEGIKWAKSLGVPRVVFEMDAKAIVDAIGEPGEDWSELGRIIRSCRKLLESEPSYMVQFTKRQANVVAHALARASCSYVSPSTWVEPPPFVVAHLDNICNSHVP